MNIPIIIQMQPAENGAAALCMMLGYYKRYVPLEEMREVCISSRNGSSPNQIAAAAGEYGLDASVEKIPASELAGMKLPLLVQWKRRYYAIIKSVHRGLVRVAEPISGEYELTWEKFESVYTGTAIILTKNESFHEGGKKVSLVSQISRRVYPVRKTLIFLAILTSACVGLNLGMTKLQSEFLDKVLDQAKNVGTEMLWLYLAALLAYTLLSMVKTKIINKRSRDCSADSGSRLFKKIFDQPMRFFEEFSPYNIISRIENNQTLDLSILTALVPRFLDVLMTMVYIATLFRAQAEMTMVCLLLIVISTVISLYIENKNVINSRSMVSNSTMVQSSLLNGINMIETIKSTGAEQEFYNMWFESQDMYNQSLMSRYRFSALNTLVSELSQNFLSLVQLFLGAVLVTRGEMTLGTMAFFQSVLTSTIKSINNSLNTVDTMQSMRTNIERVDDIHHRETRKPIPLDEAVYGEPDKLDGSVKVSHLCYRYNKGDDLAVNDVSLEVKPGQMIALVGSTGCGKSTILKMIADLYTPESGQILYSGKSRDEIPDVIFHSSVGTVNQETIMFEDSIYNNIRMWDNTIENYELVMAVRDADIEKRILRENGEYSALIQENGRNFSGGELQRIELARALAHEPTILLLDEFTSALDALTEDRVIRAIKRKEATAIIVAHRLSTIVDCDRIYVLDHGRVVQEGTHDELYAQEGLYRQLIGRGERQDGTLH